MLVHWFVFVTELRFSAWLFFVRPVVFSINGNGWLSVKLTYFYFCSEWKTVRVAILGLINLYHWITIFNIRWTWYHFLSTIVCISDRQFGRSTTSRQKLKFEYSFPKTRYNFIVNCLQGRISVFSITVAKVWSSSLIFGLFLSIYLFLFSYPVFLMFLWPVIHSLIAFHYSKMSTLTWMTSWRKLQLWKNCGIVIWFNCLVSLIFLDHPIGVHCHCYQVLLHSQVTINRLEFRNQQLHAKWLHSAANLLKMAFQFLWASDSSWYRQSRDDVSHCDY